MMLSDADADKQVNQMIAFIQEEAAQKVEELDSKAEEDYHIEKSRLFQEESNKIDAYHKKRRMQNSLNQKIQNSQIQNLARMRILMDREAHMRTLRDLAHRKLVELVDDQGRYQKFLEGFLTQALFQMTETEVIIRCLEDDVSIVKSVIPSCAEEYQNRTHTKVVMKIDQHDFLKEGEVSGGIELLTPDGRVIVVNTIESRLEMLYQQMLPDLRVSLFGKNVNRRFFD